MRLVETGEEVLRMEATYSGTAGYYYWKVLSYSGSGSYSFTMTKP